jgi:hypothetical protein
MTNQSGNDHVARDGLNRRQVLGIGAGLSVLGVVGLEGTAHAADGLGADGRPIGAVSLDPQTVPASSPGLSYSTIGIFDFFTTNANARDFAGGGVLPASGGFLVSTGLHLPIGAILKEWVFWAANSAGSTFDVALKGFALDAGSAINVGTITVPDGTTASTPLTGPIAGTTHVISAGHRYHVEANMTGGGTQRLFGARFGYQLPAQFFPINAVRVYDSRQSAYAVNGVLTPNSSRVISVKDGHASNGSVNAADVVPAGATAIAFNVTVTGATGPNFLSIMPGDATAFTASTINFPAGDDRAVGGVVKLDATRQIKIFCGDQTGSTHAIVDVNGYYL